MRVIPAAARMDMCEEGSTANVLCERPNPIRQPLSAEIVFWSMGTLAVALLAILFMRLFARRKEGRPPKR